MPVRSKKKWTPNSRGLYSRNIGQIEKKNGKTLPQRFYLGKDLTEAKRRNMRLEQLWECIETEHEKFNWPLRWNDLTLMIGMEISKGIYQIVVPRKNNHADSYARFINRLQNAFPMVAFIPEEKETATYQQGTEQARSVAMSSIHIAMQIVLAFLAFRGRLPGTAVSTATPALTADVEQTSDRNAS